MGSPNDLHYVKQTCSEFQGRVLEIGARFNSTGFRGYFENIEGAEYFGTDLEPGPDVNYVCDLTQDDFDIPQQHFDLVICCSVLEHIADPWKAARNISKLVKPGGKLYINCPWAWKYHPYPDDYYRFSFSGIKHLFPEFDWTNYAYSGELDGDIRWINENEVGRDAKWCIFEEWPDGRKKKYISYLLINMLGTKKC